MDEREIKELKYSSKALMDCSTLKVECTRILRLS